MDWDLEHLRKIAGLNESASSKSQTLNESYDDDDEDPDVKHADDELKKRKVKLPDAGKVDPDKDIHDLAEKRKARAEKKKAEDKPKAGGVADLASKQLKAKEDAKKDEPKKAEPKKETEDKKEDKKESDTPAEKKKRGKAENPASKSGQLRAFIQKHFDSGQDPKAVRKAAWKWASETCDPPFTAAGFSTIYQGIKAKNAKKAAESETKNECWIIRHPSIPSFILKENTVMNMYQWISDSDVYDDPMIFETEDEAKKVAAYLLQFKNQLSDIEHVDLDI